MVSNNISVRIPHFTPCLQKLELLWLNPHQMTIDPSLTLSIWKYLSALPDIMWHKWFEICLHGPCGSKVQKWIFILWRVYPTRKWVLLGEGGGGGMTARHASPAHTLIMNSHTDFATWSPIFFAPEKTVENLKGRGACMTQYFCPTNREERVVTNRRTASVSQWQSVPWC